MQRYLVAMKRIEAGQLPPIGAGKDTNSAGKLEANNNTDADQSAANGDAKEDTAQEEMQAVRVASNPGVAAAPNQSQCCIIA